MQGGDVTGVEEVRVELRAVFYEELDVDGADADGVVRAGARDGRDLVLRRILLRAKLIQLPIVPVDHAPQVVLFRCPDHLDSLCAFHKSLAYIHAPMHKFNAFYTRIQLTQSPSKRNALTMYPLVVAPEKVRPIVN